MSENPYPTKRKLPQNQKRPLPLKNSNLTNLRDYQIEDVKFLKKLETAGCFNEPRTGKTPTALIVFSEKHINKFVIVVPASALYPWADECATWTDYPAVVCTGTPLQKHKIIEKWEQGALIISYGSLKEPRTNLLSAILRKHPDGCIIDEAHRIKDRNSANAIACFNLAIQIKNRLALTGTPAPNKPDEIWSILHFLLPEQFKSYWNFVNDFCYVSTRMNQYGTQFKDVGALKPSKTSELQHILNNIATMRKRKDVMQWLPEKEPPVRIKLPATKEQEKYLDELKNFFETEEIITQGILDRLIRYRQICLHPALINLKGKSPKLEWIKDYLADYPDRPTILFSKFTSFIHILDTTLEKYPHKLIIGDVSSENRTKAIAEFQSGKINLLLINIDAGKENLTLDRAEVAIFTDKFPPAGDIDQAEARFIATVPEKAHIPKTIYELCIKGTYDEQCYDLVEKRAQSVDAINNFKLYMKGGN